MSSASPFAAVHSQTSDGITHLSGSLEFPQTLLPYDSLHAVRPVPYRRSSLGAEPPGASICAGGRASFLSSVCTAVPPTNNIMERFWTPAGKHRPAAARDR